MAIPLFFRSSRGQLVCASIHSPASLPGQPQAADAGAVELVLAANDGELITTQSYILEILFEPGLQPPRLSPPNGLALDAAADYMATLVLNPLVHDPDHADSALVWTLTHISGDAVTIDYDRFAQTARFTARPDFAAAQVRLQVSDPDSLSAEIVLHLAVLQSGDFNNDTTIDQSDLVPFVEAFGARPEQHDRWNENVDLNGDGRIDFADFFLFLFAK